MGNPPQEIRLKKGFKRGAKTDKQGPSSHKVVTLVECSRVVLHFWERQPYVGETGPFPLEPGEADSREFCSAPERNSAFTVAMPLVVLSLASQGMFLLFFWFFQ